MMTWSRGASFLASTPITVCPPTGQQDLAIMKGLPKKNFEFFTVPIRNANTRAAYYRAVKQFLALPIWSFAASVDCDQPSA